MKDFVLFGYMSYLIHGRKIFDDCVVENAGRVEGTLKVKKPNTFSRNFLKQNNVGGSLQPPKRVIIFTKNK